MVSKFLISFLFLFTETPLGQMPVLNYNGVEIAQSMTIARFLANELNLAGNSNVEKAKADMVVDIVVDLFGEVVKIMTAPEDKKAEIKEKFEKEKCPAHMKNLEKLLSNNGGKFFVGNNVRDANFSNLPCFH